MRESWVQIFLGAQSHGAQIRQRQCASPGSLLVLDSFYWCANRLFWGTNLFSTLLPIITYRSSPPPAQAPRDRDQVREEAGSGANVWDFPCLSGLLQACLDDMLFIRAPGATELSNVKHLFCDGSAAAAEEKDETLYEHRKDNSIAVLFCKALVSQSLLALVLSSAWLSFLETLSRLKQKATRQASDQAMSNKVLCSSCRSDR